MTYRDLLVSVEKNLDLARSSGKRPSVVILQTLRNLDEEEFVKVMSTMPLQHIRKFVGFVGDDLEFLLTDFLGVEVFGIE